ncbi:hydantoinase B/oxoprolinase family protein [Xylophilus sp. GOD-11R]|uniref:hydantoinase B/oxoprolinase family protein n=1 Tax=Xylophilus sp. GOD-11R TaxID=3089814 RepID=UPI00298C18C9|nr:hydantoinase B/oxoprolinase family protein [Xylophilus sp. GOD-11R]WPB59112.1 hydantoinase B/oxoprolinase family protein [Xylophilus sp. GOD-11R]
MATRFDAITLELLWTRLISIVDEAAVAMVRTSFSTNVRESNDFACVLTDTRGHSLAQATHSIPSFLNTVPQTIRHFIAEFPEDQLSPDDVLITNDIWQGTGHLPDITVAKPIFHRGRIVGWAGSVAHAPDIGGRVRSADARTVFEEGLQIPIMKVMRQGVMDPTFERILRKNVRVPDQVMGDLYAQFTALQRIESRVLAQLEEHDLESLDGLAHEIQTRSEAAMRAAIRKVPEGVYRQSAVTDGIGEPIRLEMTMTVKDGAIAVDYSGTDPQVAASINVCLAYTKAYTCYGVRTVLLPDVAGNEGVIAPIEVTAPAGCILNALPPAAGGARALVGHMLPMMVVQALAEAMPDRVIAGVGSPLWCANVAGQREDGSTYANMFFMNGGYGASSRRDGINVLSWPSNISSTPVEMIEQMLPIHVHHRQLREDGGGRGEFRGGTGQSIKFENRASSAMTASFMAERTRPEAAAPGLAGGDSGAPGEVLIDGKPCLNPKVQQVIQPGSVVEMKTPGGGGYGRLARRDAARHAADVRDAYVGA